MTNFGKWLGVENGKVMLSEIFIDNCTKEQAKNAVTTYCMIFGIEVGTKQWDELMQWIWDNYNSWFDSKSEMAEYIAQDLV